MVDMNDRERVEKFPLSVVIIAMVMFFVALGTDAYWFLKLIGKPVAETLPVGPEVYRAFVYPDIVLSVLLYVGAFGLLRLRKFGFVTALLGLGMWLSDLLLIFGLTKWDRISFVAPCLLFVVFSIGYLGSKKHLFQ
jgi:hypothetical protein